jgi:8-oxo-dGTP diphosphatase
MIDETTLAGKDITEVATAIVEEDGNVLIAKRNPDAPTYSGKWEFPGGKLESGEEPDECAYREFKEELDIRIVILDKLPRLVYTASDAIIVCHYFMALVPKGEKKPKLKVHSGINWVHPEELLHLDMLPSDYLMIPTLCAYMKNPITESQKTLYGRELPDGRSVLY